MEDLGLPFFLSFGATRPRMHLRLRRDKAFGCLEFECTAKRIDGLVVDDYMRTAFFTMSSMPSVRGGLVRLNPKASRSARLCCTGGAGRFS